MRGASLFGEPEIRIRSWGLTRVDVGFLKMVDEGCTEID
jgi:hypothetical protein